MLSWAAPYSSCVEHYLEDRPCVPPASSSSGAFPSLYDCLLSASSLSHHTLEAETFHSPRSSPPPATAAMQILARASEDLPFFLRRSPKPPAQHPRTPLDEQLHRERQQEQQLQQEQQHHQEHQRQQQQQQQQQQHGTPPLVPLELVFKATSALRTASVRAQQAFAEFRGDLMSEVVVVDPGGPSQSLEQHPDARLQLFFEQPFQPSESTSGPGWPFSWGSSAKPLEEQQREQSQSKILELSREPARFLVPPPGATIGHTAPMPADAIDPELALEAEAAMEADPNLRVLREELVPRMLPEAEFWGRYFQTVRDVEMEVFRRFSPLLSSASSDSAWSPGGPGTGHGSPVLLMPLGPGSAGAASPKAVGLESCSVSDDEAGEDREDIPLEDDDDEVGGGTAMDWVAKTPEKPTIPPLALSPSMEPCPLNDHPRSLPEEDSTPGLPSTSSSMPPSAAVRRLYSAGLAVAGYGSCADILAVDASATRPKLGPLSAFSGSFRRQLADGSGDAGKPPRRVPVHQDLLEDLFSCSSNVKRESKDGKTSGGIEKAGTRLCRSLRGAPPGSFVARLATAVAGLQSVQEVAQLWLEVVEQLRCRFRAGDAIPGVPLDTPHPDLKLCELIQHLQLLNLCIDRRTRRTLRLADLARERMEQNSTLAQSGAPGEDGPALDMAQGDAQRQPLVVDMEMLSPKRDSSWACPAGFTGFQCTSPAAPAEVLGHCRSQGETEGPREMGPTVRRGVKDFLPGVALLETGEPLCIPETQEAALMTETAVRESEELIMKTGTLGFGCKQLFCDMQAFKAANPGCVLEDFVRWYSPPDWSAVPYACSSSSSMWEDGGNAVSGEPSPRGSEADSASDGNSSSSSDVRQEGYRKRGYLSFRMTFAGNMWQELWQRAEAVSAIEQPLLFDIEEEGENSLRWLEELPPSELLEQLFITLLGLGFSAAQASPEAAREPLRTAIGECSRYATSACSHSMGPRKQQMVCMVYEVLEASWEAAAYAMSNRSGRGGVGSGRARQSAQGGTTPQSMLTSPAPSQGPNKSLASCSSGSLSPSTPGMQYSAPNSGFCLGGSPPPALLLNESRSHEELASGMSPESPRSCEGHELPNFRKQQRELFAAS